MRGIDKRKVDGSFRLDRSHRLFWLMLLFHEQPEQIPQILQKRWWPIIWRQKGHLLKLGSFSQKALTTHLFHVV